MQRLSTVFLALFAISCGRDAAEPVATPGDAPSAVAARARSRPLDTVDIPADAPLVAFLGDSLSAGLHLSADEAFPAVAQQRLAAEGHPFRLINAGVSGDTTSGGVRRVDWLLSRKPDLVVVELGGNDGLRGQEVERVEENLRAIVERVKASGARVLLLGMQLPPSLGGEYGAAFERMYARVAQESEVALAAKFLAGVGGDPKMNLEDGLHPTAEGHRRLAENILPGLREILVELAGASVR